MTFEDPAAAALLVENVRSPGATFVFEDGAQVTREGFLSVETALEGPLGIRAAFTGNASRSLSREIDRHGPLLVAAVAGESGQGLVCDGTAIWYCPWMADRWSSSNELLTQAAKGRLVEGSAPSDGTQLNGDTTLDESVPEFEVGAAESEADTEAPDTSEPVSTREEPHVEVASNDPSEDLDKAWLDLVFRSGPVADGLRRSRVSESEARTILQVLDSNGQAGMSFLLLALKAGVPQRRLAGYLAQLKGLLNLDGYEVISISGEVARFDRALLERQLGLA